MAPLPRCPWPGEDPLYVAYHDEEWGRPVTDERTLELMAPEVRAAYVSHRAFIDTTSSIPITEQGFQRALAFDRAFFDVGHLLSGQP